MFIFFLNLIESAQVELPLHLRLLQWTCSDECKYFCMWPTSDWFETAGIGVQQFNGKVQVITLYFSFTY